MADRDVAPVVEARPAVRLLEGRRLAVLRMRNPGDAVLGAVGSALGGALPTEPNLAHGGDVDLLWLAPGEWLIDCGTAPSDPFDRVRAACRGTVHHLAMMSDAYVVVEIGGARSRDLIAKGCSLDLHPRAFGPGRCAQSLFAQLHVLLYQTDATTFRLYADASYQAYLLAWLVDASAAEALPQASSPAAAHWCAVHEPL